MRIETQNTVETLKGEFDLLVKVRKSHVLIFLFVFLFLKELNTVNKKEDVMKGTGNETQKGKERNPTNHQSLFPAENF